MGDLFFLRAGCSLRRSVPAAAQASSETARAGEKGDLFFSLVPDASPTLFFHVPDALSDVLFLFNIKISLYWEPESTL